jgi:predicted CxxxxCH...CXXCH cytochrome family protein
MTHTMASTNMPNPLGCQSCHFGENYTMLEGNHGNGEVNVIFQPAWGPNASYDFDTLRCATTCHTRGGTTPVVAWDEEVELDCASCHQNPPPGHSQIACNGCHRGINSEGTRLTIEAPHINGRVDAF